MKQNIKKLLSRIAVLLSRFLQWMYAWAEKLDGKLIAWMERHPKISAWLPVSTMQVTQKSRILVCVLLGLILCFPVRTELPDGGSVEYRYGGYGLLLRYTDKESGDDTTGLFDVYVMPNGVSLNTLNDLLSKRPTATDVKPDTCKVNPTVILAIEGETVIVDAAEHYIHRNDGRYQAFERCAFSVSGIADIRDFKVGDKVNVIHTAEFTEGDPPRGRLLALRHTQ
jgi:hypothetical protein